MSTGDPYEELAALFLTPADAPAAAGTLRESPRPVSEPPLELVLVGHLPVRAALWLAPFAGAVARQRGLTALVRLDSEEPLVQVFGGVGDPMRSTACRSLRETVQFLGRTVRTWLLRPSSRGEAGDLLAMRPDRITVLSGCDEAALVHAYRLLRQLHDAAEAAGRTLPRIDIAVLGSDETAAGDMLSRLNRTAESWAGEPFACRVVLPRIDASVRSTGLRSFAEQPVPAASEVSEWIRQARRDFHRADAAEPAAASSPGRPVVAPRPAIPLRVEEEMVEPDELLEMTASPRPMAESEPQATFKSGARARPEPLEGVASVRAARFFEAKAPADPVEADAAGAPISLTSRIEGLTELPVRMPGHEHAELAVDQKGTLHVLLHEPRLRDLDVITTWVRTHREILSLACRDQLKGRAWDPSGRAQIHVFTDDPLRVADLHGGRYHLHLLTRVHAGDGHVFICMPLARPAAGV